MEHAAPLERFWTNPDLDLGAVSVPNGVAVDASGNVFVAIGSNNFFSHQAAVSAVEEILAVDGSIPASPTIVTLGRGFALPSDVALDSSDNVFVADSDNGTVKEILAEGGYVTVTTLASGFNGPDGVAVASNGDIFVADTGNNAVKEIFFTPPTPLFAAVLPDSRSVQIGDGDHLRQRDQQRRGCAPELPDRARRFGARRAEPQLSDHRPGDQQPDGRAQHAGCDPRQ